MTDHADILNEVLHEVDQLIRRRLRERGIDAPYVVVGVSPDSQVIVRSNVNRTELHLLGQDLIGLASQPEPLSGPDNTTH